MSNIPPFLVSKTGPLKRIFLIINRYDYCDEYNKPVESNSPASHPQNTVASQQNPTSDSPISSSTDDADPHIIAKSKSLLEREPDIQPGGHVTFWTNPHKDKLCEALTITITRGSSNLVFEKIYLRQRFRQQLPQRLPDSVVKPWVKLYEETKKFERTGGLVNQYGGVGKNFTFSCHF